MHRRNYFITAAAALWALCLANSINASLVDNFELLDQRGYAHELYYLSDASAVVLMAHASSCQAANHAAGVLANLAETYGSKGVEVRLLNSNLDDDRATIRAAMDAEENGLAVLIDDTQLIGESLEFWRAGEAIVIDPVLGALFIVATSMALQQRSMPCSAAVQFQHTSNCKKVARWRARSKNSKRPTRASHTPIPSHRC